MDWNVWRRLSPFPETLRAERIGEWKSLLADGLLTDTRVWRRANCDVWSLDRDIDIVI
jgi:hypothetical protein